MEENDPVKTNKQNKTKANKQKTKNLFVSFLKMPK